MYVILFVDNRSFIQKNTLSGEFQNPDKIHRNSGKIDTPNIHIFDPPHS